MQKLRDFAIVRQSREIDTFGDFLEKYGKKCFIFTISVETSKIQLSLHTFSRVFIK